MVGGTFPATINDAILAGLRPTVTKLEAGLFITVDSNPSNPPNDVLIIEVLKPCWAASIIWKIEKIGTPPNPGKDRVRLVLKRLREDGSEEILIDLLTTELLDVVWGRNNTSAPPISVTNYDNTNNAYGLIILFKNPAYCPRGYRLRALNTSNASGDNFLVSAVVETLYMA